MGEEKQTAGLRAASRADFSQGTVPANILRLALPMVVAQLINVLYSVVDRMYIGHLPTAAGNALTGVGVTFPILTVVIAFANLFGAAARRCSRWRGGAATTTRPAASWATSFRCSRAPACC